METEPPKATLNYARLAAHSTGFPIQLTTAESGMKSADLCVFGRALFDPFSIPLYLFLKWSQLHEHSAGKVESCRVVPTHCLVKLDRHILSLYLNYLALSALVY